MLLRLLLFPGTWCRNVGMCICVAHFPVVMYFYSNLYAILVFYAILVLNTIFCYLPYFHGNMPIELHSYGQGNR